MGERIIVEMSCMRQARVGDLFYRVKIQYYLLNSNYVPDTVLSVFIYIIVLNPLSSPTTCIICAILQSRKPDYAVVRWSDSF